MTDRETTQVAETDDELGPFTVDIRWTEEGFTFHVSKVAAVVLLCAVMIVSMIVAALS